MKVLRIAYFGDSITHGLGHDHKGVPEELRWTSLVDRALRELEGEGIFCYTRNMGVNGDTTRNGVERLPEIYAFSPHIMTLQFGMNDCNYWHSDNGYPRVPKEIFRLNLIDLIDKCRAHGVERILLSTNHLIPVEKRMLNGNTYNENNRAYNTIIRSVANATRCTLCDVEARFGTAGEKYFLNENGKWIHLSTKGNERYFNCIFPFISAAVKEYAV